MVLHRKAISILIPCFNEEKCLGMLLRRLRSACCSIEDIQWTLIFVNDGSTDSTKQVVHKKLLENKDWCHGVIIDLSRNFGKEAALIAGLDQCTSEACIIMDADLQDPPEVLPEMVQLWHEGYDIVNAKRDDRDSDPLPKRITAWAFYWLFKATSKLEVEVDVSDFRLLSKSVITAIQNCRESIRFSKGFFAWAGFSNAIVTYNRPRREAGDTKWGSWRLWNYALDGIFNFSTAPLRIWAYIGIMVTITAFALGIRILILVFLQQVNVPGYASLFVLIAFLGGIQLIGLGIIGEYMGRTYIETKRRPLYLAREIIEI
jgi:glycosyltransferase involved in cell wall biosynthesis